jgi:hypothetical protein
MKYTDHFGNMCTRYVDCPQVISFFFASSNKIDVHNQLRQDCLRLTKKWITQDPLFCLGMMLVGISVTDTFLLANHHKVINYSSNACKEKEQKISIQRFAGILAQQLIDVAKKISGPSLRFLPENSEGNGVELRISNAKSDFSLPTFAPTLSSSTPEEKNTIHSLPDANGMLHHLVRYEVTKDLSCRQRTKMRKASCASQTTRDVTLANTALNVERVLAWATNVNIEIAFMSTCIRSKELEGTQRKTDAYLKLR